MKNERFCVKIGVLLRRDHHLLLMRRYQTGWQDGTYGLIAGHLEKGETIYQCAIREAKEEARVTIKEKDLQFIHSFHLLEMTDYVYFFFLVDTWIGEPQIGERDKCDDMQWFDETRLPDTMPSYGRFAWENYKRGIFFSSY